MISLTGAALQISCSLTFQFNLCICYHRDFFESFEQPSSNLASEIVHIPKAVTRIANIYHQSGGNVALSCLLTSSWCWPGPWIRSLDEDPGSWGPWRRSLEPWGPWMVPGSGPWIGLRPFCKYFDRLSLLKVLVLFTLRVYSMSFAVICT